MHLGWGTHAYAIVAACAPLWRHALHCGGMRSIVAACTPLWRRALHCGGMRSIVAACAPGRLCMWGLPPQPARMRVHVHVRAMWASSERIRAGLRAVWTLAHPQKALGHLRHLSAVLEQLSFELIQIDTCSQRHVALLACGRRTAQMRAACRSWPAAAFAGRLCGGSGGCGCSGSGAVVCANGLINGALFALTIGDVRGHLAYIASHPMVGWPDAHRMRGGWLIWRASHARRVDDLACIACAAAAVGLVFGATTHLPLLADPTAVSACSTLLGPPWCGSAWCGPAWCGPAWCGC
eukprot:365639-Chlamydomonas_euryale.AAC.3